MPAFAMMLLAAATSQAGLAVEPLVAPDKTFTIKSTEERLNTFPYPTTRKLTTLTWNARTPMLTYVLEDDGERLEAGYSVGLSSRDCLGRLGPLTFDFKATELFGPDLFLSTGCASAVPKGQTRPLRRMIDSARRDFPAAYAAFLNATKLQHGPTERRCEEYGFGHHGPICERYSDEKK